MPNLYIIGGCNGAGKTTTAMKLLPEILNCDEYVNADAIAAGLSPFDPVSVAFQAGRLMIERIKALAGFGKDFAFESTLASRSFAPFLRESREQGYRVTLVYFWLHSPELVIARVADQVQHGGHDIPEEVIRRRYKRSRYNLGSLYLPLADRWILCDNSLSIPSIIAEYSGSDNPIIYDMKIYESLLKGR